MENFEEQKPGMEPEPDRERIHKPFDDIEKFREHILYLKGDNPENAKAAGQDLQDINVEELTEEDMKVWNEWIERRGIDKMEFTRLQIETAKLARSSRKSFLYFLTNIINMRFLREQKGRGDI